MAKHPGGLRICTVEGCEREARKRGWCIPHYRRWQRHGDPLGGAPDLGPRYNGQLCSVAGCHRPAEKRGWCGTHYQQWRLANRPPPPPCSVDGCDNPTQARGWCHKHYWRWRTHGDPLTLAERAPTPIVLCPIAGCGRPASGRGWCNAHYQRWYQTGDPLTPLPRDPAPEGSKTCTGCHTAKPLGEFHQHTKARLGRSEKCKRCASIERKATYERDVELHRQRRRDYVARNQALVNERHAAWAKENAVLLRTLRDRRRAILLAAFVEDVDRMVVYARDLGICGICGSPVDRRRFHVDHIVPLARGGEHSYANVQLAHPICNMRKNTKLPGEIATVS